MRIVLIILFLFSCNKAFAKKSRTLNLNISGITDVSTLDIPNRIRNLLLSGNSIESFEGLVLPSKIKKITATQNNLINLNGLESDSLQILLVGTNPLLKDYSGLVNLPNLKELAISGNFLDEDNFDINDIPDTVEILFIGSNAFTELDLSQKTNIKDLNMTRMFSSLDGFQENFFDYSKVILPNAIETIWLGSRDYPDVLTDLVLPDSVTELNLSNSLITTEELKTLNFPPNLRKLRIKRNSIETLDGIEFPDSLRVLNLQLGPMTKEEKQKVRARLGRKVKIKFKCGRKCSNRP